MHYSVIGRPSKIELIEIFSAVLNSIFRKSNPEGKLPFELPSSMAAVQNQKADVTHDSEDPLYSFGFGLSY